MAISGVVSEWNDQKGYGFISVNDEPIRIVFHIGDLSGHSVRPKVQEKVTFTLAKDGRGNLRATDVHRPITFGFSFALVIWFITTFVASLYLLNYPTFMISYLLLISGTTYSLYALDKVVSNHSRWQIPESLFHLASVLGGWPGAVFAQSLLRHKPISPSFNACFWLSVFLSLTLYTWSLTPNGRVDLQALLMTFIV